ncbi:transposase [Arthrobacter sp. W1]|nr:transposase [Arthrobacter sp. W1]
MSKRQQFTPEFRAEAVELVISSQKSLIEVAASLGINEGTLGNWVRAYRTEHPEAETEERGPVEWAQYKKLRKELLEVKRENDFLKDVSAYFASNSKKLAQSSPLSKPIPASTR